jgi:acetoin:2,6-dichlorophenolindophenol oxidoreductase subunit alpha
VDVFAVADAAAEAMHRLRGAGGPILLEARTRRWRGHYEGDPQRYRAATEAAEAAAHDPVAHARAALLASGTTETALQREEADARAAVEAAVAAGRAAPEAAWDDARNDAYAAQEA